jgi:hypothetical protein
MNAAHAVAAPSLAEVRRTATVLSAFLPEILERARRVEELKEACAATLQLPRPAH